MITEDQFTAIAALMRLNKPATKETARLVFVEGMKSSAAAKVTGISPQSASNTVIRVRKSMALARIAAGMDLLDTQ